jgi:hypothetical protein
MIIMIIIIIIIIITINPVLIENSGFYISANFTEIF